MPNSLRMSAVGGKAAAASEQSDRREGWSGTAGWRWTVALTRNWRATGCGTMTRSPQLLSATGMRQIAVGLGKQWLSLGAKS